MDDYVPLLARAVVALDPNTREMRHVLYDRARMTLVCTENLNPHIMVMKPAKDRA